MDETGERAEFMSSIADLMTSLAVIFILLLIVYVNKSSAETMQLKAVLKQTRQHAITVKDVLNQSRQHTITVKDELKRRLAAVHIPAENDPRDALALVYYVRDDRLQFDVDKAILSPRGRQFLETFIPGLSAVLCSADMFPEVDSVLIEGHTDSDGNDEHNLRLSQDRAYTVWQFALDQCRLPPRERDCLLQVVSTNGMGERSLLPEGSKAGYEDKPRSRRVEFRIRVKSMEQKDLSFTGRFDPAGGKL